MSYGRPLEPDEREVLVRNQRSRIPHRETARQLGRSEAGVRSLASDHGILQPRPKPWTPEQDARICALARAGLSVREIARQVGRAGVGQRLRRLGLTVEALRAEGARQ